MPALIDLAIRALVLLSIAWAIVALMRHRSASLRASLWALALAGVLALPAISAIAPALRLPVLAAAATPAPVPVIEEEIVIEHRAAAPASAAAEPVAFNAPDAPVASAVPTAPVHPVVPVVAFVAIILLVRIAVSYRRLHRIAEAASPADAAWTSIVRDARADFGIASDIPVRITDATTVPAVAGLLNPVLLLPVDTDDWPAEVRRVVVYHEFAHVARRDAVSQLVGHIACAVYWFVPLAWYGARRAAALRERASDDAVIAAGIRPSAYASTLIELASSGADGWKSSAALAMAGRARIHERVAAILTPNLQRDRVSWRAALALALGTTVATLALGTVELVARQEGPALGQTGAPLDPPAAAQERTIITDPQDRPAPGPATRSTAAEQSRLCAGRGLDHSSTSIQENNGRRNWTVKLSGAGCTIDLRSEGTIEFNADFTDVARLGASDFFRVDVTDGGVRRQLDIESRNGALVRTWRVDGREQPYDDAARKWFAAFLIEIDRRTAIGIDVRLPHLLKQGGVDAVLAETALFVSDYARHLYYRRLASATRLSPADTARIIRQAVTVNTSDYYASELVAAYGRTVTDAGVRAALVSLIEKMKSDHYQATSIEAILGAGAPAAAEMEVLVRLVPGMKSDHYKSQVLQRVMRAGALNAIQRAMVATTAASIGGDHDAAAVLTELAKAGLGDDAVRRAYYAALDRIASDHYQNVVLTAAVAGSSVTERELLDAVAGSQRLPSEYHRSQVLERVARHPSATDRVRTSVVDAIGAMSRHYAERVRKAAGK